MDTEKSNAKVKTFTEDEVREKYVSREEFEKLSENYKKLVAGFNQLLSEYNELHLHALVPDLVTPKA